MAVPVRRVPLPALLAALLVGFGASAHEGADSLAAWYRSLTTINGGSCCNMRDCLPTDARIAGDHWEVPTSDLTGWEAVPSEAVLKRENEQGAAVVCRYGGRILCFVPASET